MARRKSAGGVVTGKDKTKKSVSAPLSSSKASKVSRPAPEDLKYVMFEQRMKSLRVHDGLANAKKTKVVVAMASSSKDVPPETTPAEESKTRKRKRKTVNAESAEPPINTEAKSSSSPAAGTTRSPDEVTREQKKGKKRVLLDLPVEEETVSTLTTRTVEHATRHKHEAAAAKNMKSKEKKKRKKKKDLFEQDDEKRQERKLRKEQRKARREKKERRRLERMTAAASCEASKDLEMLPKEGAILPEGMDGSAVHLGRPCLSPNDPTPTPVENDLKPEVELPGVPNEDTADRFDQESAPLVARESVAEHAEESADESNSQVASDGDTPNTSLKDDTPSSPAKKPETIDWSTLTLEQRRTCDMIHNLPWNDEYENMLKAQMRTIFAEGKAREITVQGVREQTEEVNCLHAGLFGCNYTLRKQSRKVIRRFAAELEKFDVRNMGRDDHDGAAMQEDYRAFLKMEFGLEIEGPGMKEEKELETSDNPIDGGANPGTLTAPTTQEIQNALSAPQEVEGISDWSAEDDMIFGEDIINEHTAPIKAEVVESINLGWRSAHENDEPEEKSDELSELAHSILPFKRKSDLLNPASRPAPPIQSTEVIEISSGSESDSFEEEEKETKTQSRLTPPDEVLQKELLANRSESDASSPSPADVPCPEYKVIPGTQDGDHKSVPPHRAASVGLVPETQSSEQAGELDSLVQDLVTVERRYQTTGVVPNSQDFSGDESVAGSQGSEADEEPKGRQQCQPSPPIMLAPSMLRSGATYFDNCTQTKPIPGLPPLFPERPPFCTSTVEPKLQPANATFTASQGLVPPSLNTDISRTSSRMLTPATSSASPTIGPQRIAHGNGSTKRKQAGDQYDIENIATPQQNTIKRHRSSSGAGGSTSAVGCGSNQFLFRVGITGPREDIETSTDGEDLETSQLAPSLSTAVVAVDGSEQKPPGTVEKTELLITTQELERYFSSPIKNDWDDPGAFVEPVGNKPVPPMISPARRPEKKSTITYKANRTMAKAAPVRGTDFATARTVHEEMIAADTVPTVVETKALADTAAQMVSSAADQSPQVFKPFKRIVSTLPQGRTPTNTSTVGPSPASQSISDARSGRRTQNETRVPLPTYATTSSAHRFQTTPSSSTTSATPRQLPTRTLANHPRAVETPGLLRKPRPGLVSKRLTSTTSVLPPKLKAKQRPRISAVAQSSMNGYVSRHPSSSCEDSREVPCPVKPSGTKSAPATPLASAAAGPRTIVPVPIPALGKSMDAPPKPTVRGDGHSPSPGRVRFSSPLEEAMRAPPSTSPPVMAGESKQKSNAGYHLPGKCTPVPLPAYAMRFGLSNKP